MNLQAVIPANAGSGFQQPSVFALLKGLKTPDDQRCALLKPASWLRRDDDPKVLRFSNSTTDQTP